MEALEYPPWHSVGIGKENVMAHIAGILASPSYTPF